MNKNWADLVQIDQQNVNLSMDSFFKNMNSILDAHAPFKKVNKYKQKSRTKPWITPALHKSMSIKNNLLKKFITATNPQIKETCFLQFWNKAKLTTTIIILKPTGKTSKTYGKA